MKEVKRIESSEISNAIGRIVDNITESHSDTENLVVVGIANGGIAFGKVLARRLSEKLGRDVAFGVANILFHRDDIGRKPIPKAADRTDLPLNIEDATVVLADDVLFSGRSARAAINEIFDQGRPACVELAILCDRGHRRLPIKANYLGFKEKTTPEQLVEVNMNADDPSGDSLTIYDTSA